MIPERCRAVLPAGHWWIVREHRGRIIVTLSAAVPCDSPLEQELVQAATRAWRRHNHPGLILLPIPAIGAAVAWAARKARQPAAATGVVAGVAMVAAAAVMPLTESPKPVPHRPPAAAAPPSTPRVSAPPHPTVPPKRAPGKTRTAQPGPVVAADVSVSLPARAHVRLPRVPPVRPPVSPPKAPPPVSVPPVTPPPVKAAGCRLVEVSVGKRLRVCL